MERPSISLPPTKRKKVNPSDNLTELIQAGDLEALKTQQPFSLPCEDAEGNSPFHIAAKHGHIEVFKFMESIDIDSSSSPTLKQNAKGETPLILAVRHNHLHMVSYLLQQVKNTNHDQKNPLHIATEAGHLALLPLLVSSGYSTSNRTSGKVLDLNKTSLLVAAGEGHLEVVQWLIKNGSSPKEKDKFGRTSILRAAEKGHLDTLKWLLNHGSSLTERSHGGETCLLVAAGGGHLEVVQWLIKNGSSIDEKTIYGKMTSLLYAAEGGHLDTVRYLLSHGCSVEERSYFGYTSILYATERGHHTTLQWLANNGASVKDKCSWNGKTCLLLAATAGNLEIIKWLLKNGSSNEERDNRERTSLICAARRGHLTTVQWLLNHGSSIHEKDNYDKTCFLHAATGGHLETVKWLAENNATSKNERGKYGSSSLHCAAEAERSNFEVVQWLLDYACPTATANEMGTILYRAIQKGHLGTIKRLYGLGYQISTEIESDGHSNLIFAAYEGHLEIVLWLLNHGSSMEEKDACGQTCLLIAGTHHFEMVQPLLESGFSIVGKNQRIILLAAGQGELQTIQWLLEHGCSLEERDEKGNSSFILAAGEGHLDIVVWLLDHGSSIDERNGNQKSALCLSVRNGKEEVVKYLLLAGASTEGVLDSLGMIPLFTILEFLVNYGNVKVKDIQSHCSKDHFLAFMKEMSRKKTNKRAIHC